MEEFQLVNPDKTCHQKIYYIGLLLKYTIKSLLTARLYQFHWVYTDIFVFLLWVMFQKIKYCMLLYINKWKHMQSIVKYWNFCLVHLKKKNMFSCKNYELSIIMQNTNKCMSWRGITSTMSPFAKILYINTKSCWHPSLFHFEFLQYNH